MANVEADHGLPKVAGQHPDVFPGSPLAVIAIFVEVLRARFRDDNEPGLPWIWHPDPTPIPGETNEPGASRTLYIESQYTENAEGRNLRPAILVEKDETQMLKLWLGNRGAIDTKIRKQLYVAQARIPVSVLCLSNKRGESANLADYAWMHLSACRDLIREAFCIHDIDPMTIGRTVPQRRSGNENETWSTSVTFACQIKFMWQTTPIAPVLAEIAAKIRTAGKGDFDEGATQIVLYGK